MVILPEERGYMEEDRGYIPGRARLYSRRARLSFVVAIFVSACSQGQRTHSARTNIFKDFYCKMNDMRDCANNNINKLNRDNINYDTLSVIELRHVS